jgi:hypothetical protein
MSVSCSMGLVMEQEGLLRLLEKTATCLCARMVLRLVVRINDVLKPAIFKKHGILHPLHNIFEFPLPAAYVNEAYKKVNDTHTHTHTYIYIYIYICTM